MHTSAARRRPGRPVNHQIEEDLRAATAKILRTSSYTALSVNAVCALAGVTQRSYHRRYPSIEHLVLEMITAMFGTNAQPTTGSLYDDLLAMQRREIEMFTNPVFIHALPGLLQAFDANRQLANTWHDRFIRPRRESVAGVIQAAVDRHEVRSPPPESGTICDILLGPILVRALLPGTGPLDEEVAQRTAATAYCQAAETRVA